jgi:hypothetical protein
VIAIIDEILASYESLRADHEALHQDPNPELSHQEHRTGRRVGERLREDGSRSPAASAASAAPGWWASWPTAAGPPSCSAASSAPCGTGIPRRSGVMAAASADTQAPEILDPLTRGGLADLARAADSTARLQKEA